MADVLATTFEQMIRDHRLMTVDTPWADEIVFPYYEGLSIRNLSHTVVRLLDGKPPAGRFGTSPLDGRLWEHYWGQVKRVVLFISDGLGWRLLNEIMAEDDEVAQIVADLTGGGTLTPITSIVPSTTAAAMPAIWTGSGSAGTGMVGTCLFLREFNTLVSMLYYRPESGKHRAEVLEEWGFDFEHFIPLETLGETLTARQIPAYLLLHKDLVGTGLSRVMHRGIQHMSRHITYTDLWINLRDLLRETRGKRCFVNIYWGAVDGVSHMYGNVTEQLVIEVRRQLADLRDVLAADGVADGRTLFMLAADHGHAPVNAVEDVRDHAGLIDALRCRLAGERRFGILYLRCGMRQQIMDHVRAQLADQALCLVPSDALAAGLYGPESPAPETAARLGDLALISRLGVAVTDRPPHHLPTSMHGGLSDREMLVPLLMRAL
ncbi:MAG: alkaline phosphatase family protein [Anaerolineae bacterium]|nr:alkaline phosphatase family protein [Anaerolineae bacterium]